jgi:rfaE bifunctional protein nucleotidyltransferase chain/domain
MMLGLTKREVAARFDEIVAFAELEDFIDAPVKTYSSGMYMRLGFAVAIHVDPDVLLVDEVLAVGDEAFTHKCLDKFAEFRRRGRTVLLVTHSLDLVTRFCDEALWLDGGVARLQGDPKRVVDAYLLDVAGVENQVLGEEAATPRNLPSDMSTAVEGRWGSREVEISAVAFASPNGQPAHVFHSGDPMDIRLQVRALGDALIVAINSDRSVRANKGEGRPVTPQAERAEVLLALDGVDAVTIFDEETPHAIITAVQPDVLVKGADWGPDNIVGRDVVEARGGKVVRIDLAPGYSTTEIIRRVREL